MSDLAPTPQSIDMAMIRGWDAATMKRYMAGPLRATIFEVISNAETARQEQAAAAQTELAQAPPVVGEPATTDVAEVERVRAQRVAEEAQRVEAQRLEAEAVAAQVPKKIVLEYQVTDESGNAIGRPTHLEATSHEEMVAKVKEAHIQATRAFNRLKSQKVQSLKEATASGQIVTPPQAAPSMSDEEMIAAIKALKSDDPKVALEAHRKLQADELAKQKAVSDAELARVNEDRRQEKVSHGFLNDHKHDFNPCEANINLIRDYFQENQLPWTRDNLEVALLAKSSELAGVVQPTAPVAPNPVPTATLPAAAVTTTVAVPPVQAAPTATVAAIPPANPAVIVPRPGVNAGVVPGETSGSRPTGTTSSGITVAEITSWDAKTMREKMRNPQLRAQIQAVIAANPTNKFR
jgi:hypothetical protein